MKTRIAKAIPNSRDSRLKSRGWVERKQEPADKVKHLFLSYCCNDKEKILHIKDSLDASRKQSRVNVRDCAEIAL